MEIFIFFLCLGVFVTAIIMPWVNFYRHGDQAYDLRMLKLEVRNLRKMVDDLRARADQSHITSTETAASAAELDAPMPVTSEPSTPPPPRPSVPMAGMVDAVYGEFEEFPRQGKNVTPAPEPVKIKERSGSFYQRFEENLGARLPVWVGGIALVFAAFYLVKYSIDAGLLGPEMRLMLGGLFGLGLLTGGHIISRRRDGASLQRITQALIGAGLVALYICLYAATNIHEFLSPVAGFIGMGVVTAIGVVMSLRHGQPVAMFALIGGLLTPVLIQTDAPNPVALFAYLFVLFAGLMFVMVSMGWWLLALFALLGMYGWAGLWLLVLLGEMVDASAMLLFVTGIVLACVFFTQSFVRKSTKDTEKPESGFMIPLHHVLNITAVVGGFILLALVNFKLTLQPFDWGVLGLISLALMGLSFFRPDIYAQTLWFKIAATLGLFAFWSLDRMPEEQSMVLAGLGATYVLIPQFLLRRTHDPRLWALIQAICTPALLVIAFWTLDVSQELHAMLADRFWGIISLALSSLAALQARLVADQYRADQNIRAQLIGIYALASTAFLSLAIVFEIPQDYMALAFAMEIAAVAWIAKTLRIQMMQKTVGVLLLVFAGLNIKQILMFLALFVESIVGERLSMDLARETVLQEPLLMLGGSAVFLTLAVWLSHKGTLWAQRTTNMLVVSIVLVLSALVYYMLKTPYSADPVSFAAKADFTMRGMITVAYAAFGMLLITVAKMSPYSVLHEAGKFIVHVSMLRIFWFDLLLYNPLFDDTQDVWDTLVLNGVTLTYGLGAALSLMFLARVLMPEGAVNMVRVYSIWSLVLIFTFINCTIRHYFQGGVLAGGSVGETEIYVYSVAWLLLGIGLLFTGTKFNSQPVRVASLVVMLLTVGKVFLYDAGELEGLFRVFSFLGLGLSLIGLSFFYTRYVFAKPGIAKN